MTPVPTNTSSIEVDEGLYKKGKFLTMSPNIEQEYCLPKSKVKRR